MKKSVGVISILSVVLLSACATAGQPPLQGPVYSSFESRNAREVLFATVLDVKPVILQGTPQTTTLGSIASGGTGALIGGALGSKIGQGQGKQLATALGGIVGGSMGVGVQQRMAEAEARKQGVEIVVKLGDGSNRILSIIQEANSAENFAKGQTVRLTQQAGGYHATPL